MGKSSASAPAPDPQIGEAALKQAQTGEQWLGFAKDAFAVSQDRQKELDALTKQVTESQLGISNQQADWAKQDRARYESTFVPLQDEFINTAKNYATPEKQNEAAAEAVADVQTASANAKAADLRSSAAMGINPASGRYAGIDATTNMNTTLAAAGAANTARQQVRDKGLALQADAVNLGNGLPVQAAQSNQGSVASSGTALSGSQATNAQALSAPGIVSSGYAGAMQGYGGQASTLNQQYGLQLDGWKTQQATAAQNAAGIGSFLGGIGGLIFSDENVKENKSEIPEGDALDAVKSMPVEEWDYKPGVADGGRHVGTYAQDFKRATGKGDGRTIPVGDAIGITMRAVQDLDKKVSRIADAVGLGGRGPAAPTKGMAVAA